eukprot:1342798-Amphidinium_carterae.1
MQILMTWTENGGHGGGGTVTTMASSNRASCALRGALATGGRARCAPTRCCACARTPCLCADA